MATGLAYLSANVPRRALLAVRVEADEGSSDLLWRLIINGRTFGRAFSSEPLNRYH